MRTTLSIALLLAGVLCAVEGRSFRLHRNSRQYGTDPCEDAMGECLAHVLSYTDNDLSVFASEEAAEEFVQTNSIDYHCQHLPVITNCLNGKARSSVCQSVLSPPQIHVINAASGIVNFTCVQHLADFKTYSACFLSDTLMNGVESCQQLESFDPQTCDEGPLTDCIDDAMDTNTTLCPAGARKLAHDFVDEIISYVPGCFNIVAQLEHLNYFKKLLF